jgi:hypothetical protein
MSYPLWLPYRLFPLAPVFYSLPELSPFFCWAVYLSLLSFLFSMLIIRKSTVPIFLFCFAFSAYALFDYSRLQVYYLHYLTLLFGLGCAEYFSKTKESQQSEEFLNGIRLFFVFCYFYSGFYKLNPAFWQSIIPWFVQPFTVPLGISKVPNALGIGIAIFEVLAGLFLFLSSFRKAGVLMVIVIHGFTLACIGPFGQNWNAITWPWNIANSILVYLMFWDFKGAVLGRLWPSFSTQFKIFVVVVFGFLPILFTKGKWDSFFSFDLYSGKTKLGAIYLNEAQIASLPDGIKPYIHSHPDLPHRRYLDLSLWGFGEMRTLPYPEIRAFHKMHRNFSETYFHQEKAGVLVIYSHFSVLEKKNGNLH